MYSIKQNLKQISQRIDIAATKSGKNADRVKLLAVSKTKPLHAIEEAILAGQQMFGENYVQEGVSKIQYFRETSPHLEWHFIGPIQSNKTQAIAEHFHWVHSVERKKIALRLNEQRPTSCGPLQVLIQVNSSGEDSKSGVNIEEAKILAQYIDTCPNLVLRGLMCIPRPESDRKKQRDAFVPLASLFNEMRATRPHFDTLSMGMSDDLEAAIASGSTMVRIGSAIFGHRD